MFLGLINFDSPWWAFFVKVMAMLGILCSIGGCGAKPDERTAEQKKADSEINMQYIDKAADLAEKHGAAWFARAKTKGRPSIGMSTDLYLNTDAEIEVTVFGNGASGRQPKASPTGGN